MKNVSVLLFCAFVLGLGVMFLAMENTSSARTLYDHEVGSRGYTGVLTTTHESGECKYTVDISEVSRGGDVRRIARLKPLHDERLSEFARITGHDYNSDGEWDRVFYCGYQSVEGRSSSGCNSVTRQKDGSWTFEACRADEGLVEPFSHGEIIFAIMELDAAIGEVRKPANLNRMFFWDDMPYDELRAERESPIAPPR